MNFLGHLYFSNNNPELMYANLFGDFVKGKDLSIYSTQIQKGILLHRTIDDYIDHHPAVVKLRHELYESLPKVSGIAIDLFFDHILAKRWSEFHLTPLEKFIASFHQFEIEQQEYHNQQFWFVLSKMKEQKWLNNYATMNGLTKACEGLSNRISFPNVLNKAPEVYLEMEINIESAFNSYMKDAIPYFKSYYKAESL